MYTRMRGMTLIELMTVVAVVAILSTFAVSSYRNSVLRAHRTDARAAVLRIAAQQEKFFLQNGRYADDSELATAPPAGLGIPAETDGAQFGLTIQNVDTARDFIAVATAQGGQLNDTDCRSLSVDQTGQRLATNDGGADNSAFCWR